MDVFCFVFRAVRGVVGHGDASGPEDDHEGGGGVFSSRVRPLRCAHRVHPAGDGGFISFPPRSEIALVSLPVPTDLNIHNHSSVKEFKMNTVI